MDLKQQTDTMTKALERRMEQEADAAAGDARLREERRDSTMTQTVGSAPWRAWIARRSERVRKEDAR
jgi:hypothetical protein